MGERHLEYEKRKEDILFFLSDHVRVSVKYNSPTKVEARAQEELRQALGRKEHLRTLAHRRELVLKLWKRLGGDRPESANSAERMQWYERLQVTATPTGDGDLRLRGLFDDADVSHIKSRRWRASRPASRPSGGLKS